jgi:hypothetical protein
VFSGNNLSDISLSDDIVSLYPIGIFKLFLLFYQSLMVSGNNLRYLPQRWCRIHNSNHICHLLLFRQICVVHCPLILFLDHCTVSLIRFLIAASLSLKENGCHWVYTQVYFFLK